MQLAEAPDAIPAADCEPACPGDAAEVTRERELDEKAGHDREEEEAVHHEVVREQGPSSLPALKALEHGLVVEVEREEGDVGDGDQLAPPAPKRAGCDASVRAASVTRARPQTATRPYVGRSHVFVTQSAPRTSPKRASRSHGRPLRLARTAATTRARASAASGSAIACAWRSP